MGSWRSGAENKQASSQRTERVKEHQIKEKMSEPKPAPLTVYYMGWTLVAGQLEDRYGSLVYRSIVLCQAAHIFILDTSDGFKSIGS